MDVAAARADRGAHARLVNDHRALSERIAEALAALHAAAAAAPGGPVHVPASEPRPAAPPPPTTTPHPQTHPPPPPPAAFALVDGVAEGSPAARAGLRVGDRVAAVGAVRAASASSSSASSSSDLLRRAGETVARAASRDELVRVSVLRPGPGVGVAAPPPADVVETVLVVAPREGWGGVGVLGCHMVPLVGGGGGSSSGR